MDFTEKWGTDVDTAVKLALQDLKADIDDVNVKVLEEPSRGFFGIGSKLALVRVELKKEEVKKEKTKVEKVKQVEIDKKENLKLEISKSKEVKAEIKEEPKKEIKRELKNSVKKESFGEEITPDFSKMEAYEDNKAVPFLKEVSEKMGLELNFSSYKSDGCILIKVDGKDTGTIIGKRGQTLDAIQYLTSLVVNKEDNDYLRVIVDAENYRARREQTLERLANKLASNVVKTRRSVKLEPMNPYERKVIHSTLQKNPRVKTRSEGQDPYRKVVIELK